MNLCWHIITQSPQLAAKPFLHSWASTHVLCCMSAITLSWRVISLPSTSPVLCPFSFSSHWSLGTTGLFLFPPFCLSHKVMNNTPTKMNILYCVLFQRMGCSDCSSLSFCDLRANLLWLLNNLLLGYTAVYLLTYRRASQLVSSLGNYSKAAIDICVDISF